MDVGARLMYLRKSISLSQRELAKRAGVPNSTISTIEKNSVSPSISSLKKILDVIPISLTEFFGSDLQDNASFFFSANKMINVGTGGVLRKIMSRSMEGNTILLMDETFPANTSTGEMMSHVGVETGLIVEGEIELTVGDRTETLKQGDGYYFDSEEPHRFENTSDIACRLICCTTPGTF